MFITSIFGQESAFLAIGFLLGLANSGFNYRPLYTIHPKGNMNIRKQILSNSSNLIDI